MPSIGDVIMAAREQFPDIPQTFAAPPLLTLTAGSSGILNGTYYVVVTGTNDWGETVQSNEMSVTVGPTGSIVVDAAIVVGLTGGRAYFGNSGNQQEYILLDSTGAGTITGGTGTPGVFGGRPPLFNSAFNPDSDGSNIGVYTMYRWLNDAIQELSRISGGILDMTGVQASTVQADYVIPANPPWIRFTDAWFDGYFCQDFKRRNQWRRQFISAISFYWSVEQVNRQMILNFYPVPNRNGTIGTLASGMTSTQNTIPMTAIPAGLMTPGMCQIDNEIIIYSTSIGNTLTGAIRGMGGSTAAIHQPNATVTEFNLVLAGFRQPNTYSVGQASNLFSVPVGWEIPISNFLLARYRNYEQNAAEAKNYYDLFIQEAKRIAFDSRQFPSSAAIGGPASFLTLYPGGPFGVIVP